MKKVAWLLYIGIMLFVLSSSSIFAAVNVKGNEVTFTWKAPNAKQVFLAGTFNGWSDSATPMTRGSDGVWSVTVQLNPGRYQYKFVVDNVWFQDTECPGATDDGMGGKNSMFAVNNSTATATVAGGTPLVNGNNVTFTWKAPNAKQVFLAGTFNGWSDSATPMTRGSDGVWSVTVQLNPGRYQYKFVVDNVWFQDTECPGATDDGMGGKNSVFVVPNPGESTGSGVFSLVPYATIEFINRDPENGNNSFLMNSYFNAMGTMFANWDYYSQISVTKRFGSDYDQNAYEAISWNPYNYTSTDNQIRLEHMKLIYTGLPYVDISFKQNAKAWDYFSDPLTLLESGTNDYIWGGTRVEISAKKNAPFHGGLGFGTAGFYTNDTTNNIVYANKRVIYGELFKDIGSNTYGITGTYWAAASDENGKITYDANGDSHGGLNSIWTIMKPNDRLTLSAEYVVANSSSAEGAAWEDKSGYYVSGEYKVGSSKLGLAYLSKGTYVVSELAGDKGHDADEAFSETAGDSLNQWRAQELAGAVTDTATMTTTNFTDFNKLDLWAVYDLTSKVALRFDFYNRVQKSDSDNSIYMFRPGLNFYKLADFIPTLKLYYEFYSTPDNAQYSNIFKTAAYFKNDYTAIIRYRTYTNTYDWNGSEITGPGYEIKVSKVLSKLPYKPTLYIWYDHNWYVPGGLRYTIGETCINDGFQIKLSYSIM